jgi:hypothetical protein
MLGTVPDAVVGARAWRGRTVWLLGALVAFYLVGMARAYSGLYMDDAFIGFRYAANLLAGHGFAFNPGDRVEGLTNAGWVLALAFFGLAVPIPLAAKLLGVGLMAATLVLLYLATRPLAERLVARAAVFAALPVVTVILAATQADFTTFSLLGMETPFLAAILAAAPVFMRRNWRSGTLAGLGALAFAIRPEAILFVPLTVAFALWWRAIARREAVLALALFAAGVALITCARWAYFGDFLPNTFYAKPGNAMGAIANLFAYGAGRSVNVGFPFAGLLAFAAVAVGALVLAREAPRVAAVLAAATATGLLFCIYAAPDWTEMGRYFAPYAPLAMVLFCAGLLATAAALMRVWNRTLDPSLSLFLIPLVAIPMAATTLGRAAESARLAYPGYVLTGATLVAPSQWMRDNLAAEATIATKRIGILAYYSRRRVFDYTYGLAEKDVARLVSAHGTHFEDPNHPALAAAWRARAPDYLLEDGPVIDKIAAAAGGTRANFTIHGATYRVVRAFRIGKDADWTLAERVRSTQSAEP